MRRLAGALGAGAMSLYYYVASKEELLDAMIDVVFGEIELPPEGTDWQSAMRRRAVSARQVLARHPWAIGLMGSRTSPGPANLRHHEAVTACLRRAGFSVLMATHANWLLDSYVYGLALQEASLPFDTAGELADMVEDVFLRPGGGVHLRPRPRPSRPRAPESLRIATLTDRRAALCTAAPIHNRRTGCSHGRSSRVADAVGEAGVRS
jgi:AcrR family transcriptional regulator